MSESIIDGTGSGNYWRINSDGAGLVTLDIGATGSKTFGQIFSGSPATQVAAASTSRESIIIYNNGSPTAFLGKSNAISGNGFPLKEDYSLTDEDTTDAWFAYTSTGSTDIRFIEVTP